MFTKIPAGVSRYLFNTTWMMVEKIARITIGLLIGVYVARYLGPERFGLLSYAISFAALFMAVSSLGIDAILVRQLVQAPEKRELLLGTAFSLKTLGAFLLLAIVYIVIQFTASDGLTQLLIMIIAAGMLLQSFNVIDFYFQSRVLARSSTLAQIFSLLVSSALKLVFIFVEAPLVWFAWVTLLESVILALSFIIMYHRQHLNIQTWRFEMDVAMDLLRDSWPLALASIAVMTYMRIDQVMIKAMMNSEAVGNYAAAVYLSEAFYFIPTVICGSLLPAMISARMKDECLYHARIQRLYDLMVWSAIAIALPTTFFAEDAITLLFGKEYAMAADALRIHIWAGIFVFLGVANGNWLMVENLQRYALYRTVLGAIMNILLNMILIPRIGITGAALATVISHSLAAYFVMGLLKQSRKNFFIATRSFLPLSAIRRILHS